MFGAKRPFSSSPSLDPGRRYHRARLLALLAAALVIVASLSGTARASAPTPTWTQVCPSSSCTTSPSARNGAGMAYDAATGQVVLFSGNNFGSPNDTWAWNGTTWTKVCPSTTCTTSPPGRSEDAMAYDPALGEV